MNSTHAKSSMSQKVAGGRKRFLVLAISLVLSSESYAGPERGQIKGGQGAITQEGKTTTVEQMTARLSVDWVSFDVDADENVQFIQPSTSSIALNRILSGSASNIQGRVDANGQLMFVNPNGVIFGESAVINAGGILASGLSIDTDAFMNGDITLRGIEQTDGVVINRGILNAATGGSISLIGKHVENTGLIQAELGTVNFASGNEAVLTFGESGFVGVRVSEALLQDDIGVDAAIVNRGEIHAASGQVLLSASVSEDVFSQAVNTADMDYDGRVIVHGRGSYTLGGGSDIALGGEVSVSGEAAGAVTVLGDNVKAEGLIEANSLADGSGGTVQLQSRMDTIVSGNATVQADAVNGLGGAVHLLGERVGLLDAASVSASGRAGGGEVLVGGDERGANTAFDNAQAVAFSAQASISANAEERGNGGRIILYGTAYLSAHGRLETEGAVGGRGGFIETSAGLVELTPLVNVGSEGHWLIDPFDIAILNGANSNVNSASPFQPVDPDPGDPDNVFISNLSIARLLGAMSGDATVEVNTGVTASGSASGGTITVADQIDYNGRGSNTLVLNAHNDIIINASIRDLGGSGDDSLNLELSADWVPDGEISDGVGDVIIANDVRIDTNGGYFTATGNRISFGSYDPLSDPSEPDNVNISFATDGGDIFIGRTANGSEPDSRVGDIYIGSGTFLRTDGGDFNVLGASIESRGNIEVIPTSGNRESGNISINVTEQARFRAALSDDIPRRDQQIEIGDRSPWEGTNQDIVLDIEARNIILDQAIVWGFGDNGEGQTVGISLTANNGNIDIFQNIAPFNDDVSNRAVGAADITLNAIDGNIRFNPTAQLVTNGGSLIFITSETTPNLLTGNIGPLTSDQPLSDNVIDAQGFINGGDVTINAAGDVYLDGGILLGILAPDDRPNGPSRGSQNSASNFTIGSADNVYFGNNIAYGYDGDPGNHLTNFSVNARGNITFDGVLADNGLGNDDFQITLNANIDGTGDDGDISFINGTALYTDGENFTISSARNVSIGNATSTALLGSVGGAFSATNLTGDFRMFGDSRLVPQVPNGRGENNRAGNITIEADGNAVLSLIDDNGFGWGESESSTAFSLRVTAGDTLTLARDIDMNRLAGIADGSPNVNRFEFTAGNQIVVDGSLLQSNMSTTNSADILFRTLNNPVPTDPSSPPGVLINAPITTNRRDGDGNLTLDSAGTIWAGVSALGGDGLPTATDDSVFLDVDGVTTLSAASDIFLNSSQNRFRDNVSINTTELGEVLIQDSDRFVFGASDIAGNLNLTAVGGVGQTDVVSIAGTSDFTLSRDSDGDNNTGLRLDNGANEFGGAIAATTVGTDISVAGANLILGRLSSNGVSGSDGGDITIASNTDSIQLLDNISSDGHAAANAGGDIFLDGNVTIGDAALLTPVDVLISGRSIAIGGDVVVDGASANGALDATLRLVGRDADGRVDLSLASTVDADLLIEGNSGSNILNGPNAAIFWTLNATGASSFGASEGATTVAFSGFETITAGDSVDTITAAGAIADITQINSGDGGDIFNLSATTVAAIAGNDGVDQLYLSTATGTHNWTITDTGDDANRISGQLGGAFSFSQVEQLFGSDGGGDNFSINEGASIPDGSFIDARLGDNAFTVNQEGRYTIGFGGNFGGIRNVQTFAAADSLDANNLYLVLADEDLTTPPTNTWTITAANTGTITRPEGSGTLSIGFRGFGNVAGNNNNDAFVFNAGVPLLRSIDGGELINTVDAQAATGTADVRYYADALGIRSDTITDVFHLANLSEVMVTGLENTFDLIADSASRAYRWIVDGAEDGASANSGRLQTLNGDSVEAELSFTGFNTLNGSDVSDSVSVIGAARDPLDAAVTTRWTINAENAGNVVYRVNGDTANTTLNFSGMDSLAGGNAVADSFSFTGDGSRVERILAGTADGIIDSVDYSGVDLSGPISLGGDIDGGRGLVTGAERITARESDAATNVLIGSDAFRFWDIDAANTGRVFDTADGTGNAIEFVNFGLLRGSGEDDVFTLVGAGARAAQIEGGGGNNILQSDTLSRRFRVSGDNSGRVTSVGASPTTLVGNFSDIQTLAGGSDGGNAFIVEASGAFAGTFSGGAGDGDLLQVIADDGGSDTRWALGGATDSFLRAGQTGQTTFANMEILQGGAGTDVFAINNGLIAEPGYSINAFGSDDGDVFDLRALADNAANPSVLSLQSLQSGAVLSRGGTRILSIQNVEVLRANNQANLVFHAAVVEGGVAAANTWRIDGTNTGSVTSLPSSGMRTIAFEGIANLVGGNGQDDFVIDAGASLRGTLDGGDDADNRLSWLASNLTWRLADDPIFSGGIRVGAEASDAVSFSNIQSLTGNNSTLIGPNLNALWSVTQQNRGLVQDDTAPGTWQIAFAGFSNLAGNAARDRFVFAADASLTGGVQGTASGFTNNVDDSLEIQRALESEVVWQLDNGGHSVGGILPLFSNVENLLGSNANDRFNINAVGALASIRTINAGANEVLADNGENADRIYWQANSNGARFSLSDAEQTVSAIGSSQAPIIFSNVEVLFGGNTNTDEFVIRGGTVAQARGRNGVDNFFIDTASQEDINLRILGGGLINENTLTAGNRPNSFVIGGADLQSNTLNYIDDANRGIVFENFGNIVGNDRADTFVLREGTINRIDGGGGADTLEVQHAANAGGPTNWQITNANAGNVEDRINTFSNIESLTGGFGRDRFVFSAAGRLSGHIDALDDPSDAASAGYENDTDIESFQDELVVDAVDAVIVQIGDAETTRGNLVAEAADIDNIVRIDHVETVLGSDVAPGDNSFEQERNENNQWIVLTTQRPTRWDISRFNQGFVTERDPDNSDVFIPGSRVSFDNFGSAQDGAGDQTVVLPSNFTGIFNNNGGRTTLDYRGRDGFFVVDIDETIEEVIGNGNTLLRITPTADLNGAENFNGENIWTFYNSNDGRFDAPYFADPDTPEEIFGFDFFGISQVQGGEGRDVFQFTQTRARGPQGSDVEPVIVQGAIIGGGGDDRVEVMAGISEALDFGVSRLNASPVAPSDITERFPSGLDADVYTAVERADRIDLVGISQIAVNASAAPVTLSSASEGSFTWGFTSSSAGSLNNTLDELQPSLNFSGISEVRGGAANDRFNIPQGIVFNYVLDGGAGDGSDTVDVSRQNRVLVDLSASSEQYRNMERFIGENTNSEFRATDNSNIWTINGVNSGTVSGGGATIAFEGFNVIRGGDLDDTFNVNSGTIRDGIFGGNNNDVLNVDLGFSDSTNPMSGALDDVRFDGQAGDQDRVTVTGGSDLLRFDLNYRISGAPELAEYGLAYTLGQTQSTTITAVNTEGMRDEAWVQTLTVNNVVNRADTLTLSNNTVAISNYLELNTSNNLSMMVMGETQDAVVVDGVLDLNQNFTVNNAALRLANDASQIRAANEVAFIGTGALGDASQALRLDTNRLVLRNLRNAAYLDNNGDIELAEMTGPAANVNLQASGTISSTAILSSLNDVYLQSANDIRLSGENLLSGRLDLLADTGSVVLNNGITRFGEVSARNMTLTARGRVSDEGGIQVADLLTINGLPTSDVVLDTATNNFGTVEASGIRSLTLVDAGADGITVSGEVGERFEINSALGITSGAIGAGAILLNSENASVATQGTLNARNSVGIDGDGITVLGTVTVSESNVADAITIDSRNGDTVLQAGLSAAGSAPGNVTITAARVDQQSGAAISGRDVTITTAEGQTLAANMAATRALTITSATGGVIWQGDVNAEQLNLDAQSGTWDLTPDATVTLGASEHHIDVSAATMQGSVNSEGSMRFDVDNTLQLSGSGNSGGAVFEVGGDMLMTPNAQWRSTADLTLDVEGDIQLASLSAADMLDLTSDGSITDVNGDAFNISAARFVGRSENGFGAPSRAEAIETQVAVLDVTNGTVGIGIINDGDVTINALVSNSDIFFLNRNGNVVLENLNPADYDLDPTITDTRDLSAVVNAGYLTGEVSLTVEDGSLQAQGDSGRARPELVGQTVTVSTETGFGNRARQITVHVEDLLSIFGPGTRPRYAFGLRPRQPLFTDQDLNDPEVLRSASDLLVGVESVEDVDLAIFTNVRNYATQEVSIRMPKDQLYEDEDEDDEDFDRIEE